MSIFFFSTVFIIRYLNRSFIPLIKIKVNFMERTELLSVLSVFIHILFGHLKKYPEKIRADEGIVLASLYF